MYHNNCLIKYFMQFQRDVDALMEINFDDPDQIPLVESTFRSFINEIDITKCGYALSDVRDALIKELEPQGISGTSITNCRLKSMHINHFGDRICFTYPKDRRQSQMFFSADIRSKDIAETIRRKDAVKICMELLLEECKSFDFGLVDSFNSAEDVELSTQITQVIAHRHGKKFFNTVFPSQSKSELIQRKCDNIFQIFHYILHNGHKQTPFHISNAQ